MEPFSSKIEIAPRDELHSCIEPRYSARQVTGVPTPIHKLPGGHIPCRDGPVRYDVGRLGYFWQHQRLWTLLTGAPFGGTPFKSMFWRMLGVKVGKRLYDPGAGIIDKTLVSIGDDCALKEGTVIQGHSLEDGTFKSGRIVLGDRCTVGVEAFVHYGVTMGDGSTVEADAFLLMKGEDVPDNTSYVGNPAREVIAPQGGRHPGPCLAGRATGH